MSSCGAERYRAHVVLMSDQMMNKPTGGSLPECRALVEGGCRDPLAVRAELRRIDRSVVGEDADLFAGPGIPYTRRLVLRCGDDVSAVGAELYSHHIVIMALECLQKFAGRGVKQQSDVFGAADEDPAPVGAERGSMKRALFGLYV